MYNSIRLLVERGATPGCVAVIIKGNDIVFQKSWGTYSGPGSKEVTLDTVYDIASITKLFTLAIVLRLYESRFLNIFDKVSKYLEIFYKSEIRIIDLMAHKTNFDIKLSDFRREFSDSFAEKVYSITPNKMPSKGIYYENINYIYLGRLVEIVSGISLADNFLKLFQSCGLTQTFLSGRNLFDSPPSESNLSGEVKNIVHDETARAMGGWAGHAGIFCNAHDLANFGLSWLQGRIVDNAILEKYVYRDYDELNSFPMGLGWWIKFSILRIVIPDTYSHTGYTGCLLAINTKNKQVFSLLCNRTYYGRNNYKHVEIWKKFLDIK